jgi:hypothetical protein
MTINWNLILKIVGVVGPLLTMICLAILAWA